MLILHRIRSNWLVILGAIILALALAGCGGAETPDPLAELVGKEWKTTVASINIAGIGGSLEMEMVFYRNGDVRADVSPVARYTGTYALVDEGLLRFNWEEEIIGSEERRALTEFWQFSLNGDELVLINDETGEERIFIAQ